MPTLSVHLLNPPDPAALALLQSRCDPGIQLTSGEPSAPAAYEVLVTGRPRLEHLTASPNLRMLVIPYAGLPAATRDLLQDFPNLAVHNLHHNATLTAEMAITLLLVAAKFIVPGDRALRQNDWRPRYQPSQALCLDGKTALILGFGQVGQRIGRACHALGMQVLALRRRPDQPTPVEYPVQIFDPAMLYQFLPHAHALMIALPATSETEGLLGARELALLPPGAVLVNVGRGAIVDQSALYTALASGQLGAAGLDVWYRYPRSQAEWENTPPADFPFQSLDNVVLSPHRAGASSETESLRMTHLADLLNAAARGDPIPNRVNVQSGY
ncbi:MAG TPA: NAD(P)-dependent oxidoreductase [Anaerolineales bacterium]|nr:NAD(P)-dependent oxidoreductase [Anaerolineales bacterium]